MHQFSVYHALRVLKNYDPLYAEIALIALENELILSKLKHEYEKIDIFDSYALMNMVLSVPLQFPQGIHREIP